MQAPQEDPSLNLLTPAPEEKLRSWLSEFYGKSVEIVSREVLRHRDLSYVERLVLKDCLPDSLIYKQVLPPWDVEQDLHERILIPSIASSAQLYMTAHSGQVTTMFLEDLGGVNLKEQSVETKTARHLGEDIARMHRAYSYRIDELIQMNVLRTLNPIDFETFANDVTMPLLEWGDLNDDDAIEIAQAAKEIAHALAGEPTTLVHGDLYAENIIKRNERTFIIDWSWFTQIGVPTMDLASLISDHPKNGELRQHVDEILEAYCFESGRKTEDVQNALPFAAALERLCFLHWLQVRKTMGILGTTVGPVEQLMRSVADDIISKRQSWS